MICTESIPLLQLLADGQLVPEQILELHTHLTSCAECNGAWQDLLSVRREVERSGSKQATPDSSARHAFRPRAAIFEKNELVRFGLKRVVSEVVDVVGEAADGMAAMDIIQRLQPEFIIVDVDLDIMNGVEVCRRVASELPKANVLVLTDSYHATKYHNQLVRAGARGFCLKSSGPRTLFEAIDQVSHGGTYCDPKIVQLIKQVPAVPTPSTTLTEREIEVLLRLDLRNKEISEELDMKLRTVEKHIESILAKLKVPTRTAAALKAVQQGYVLLPKMPERDPVTGVTHEHTMTELNAELAIANDHLRSLLKQNDLLKQALEQRNLAATQPAPQEPT
jgi:DNA-binding NarL/FixJ family response regulator